jgi:hypothetical protein
MLSNFTHQSRCLFDGFTEMTGKKLKILRLTNVLYRRLGYGSNSIVAKRIIQFESDKKSHAEVWSFVKVCKSLGSLQHKGGSKPMALT